MNLKIPCWIKHILPSWKHYIYISYQSLFGRVLESSERTHSIPKGLIKEYRSITARHKYFWLYIVWNNYLTYYQQGLDSSRSTSQSVIFFEVAACRENITTWDRQTINLHLRNTSYRLCPCFNFLFGLYKYTSGIFPHPWPGTVCRGFSHGNCKKKPPWMIRAN